MSQQQQVLLKKAEKEDWKKILQLYSSLDEDDLEYRFFNIHHLLADEARQMAEKPDHVTLLAIQGDLAIGEATLQSNGEVSVVVQKQSRGKGIARLLVTGLVEVARGRGFKRLKFFTLPSNAKMVGLGRAFGFRVLSHSNLEEEWVLDL